jgi:predicted transcriptional regulator
MTHQLTINVSDDIYQPLLAQAQATGRSPEALAAELVANGLGQVSPGELLRRWAGTIDSGVSDAAQRHDEYLGQALHDELRGK